MAGISSIFVCILRSPILLILLFWVFFLGRPCSINATHIINASTPITDGKSLMSAQGAFELGFFSPGTSPHRYLGIWFYTPDKTVVWVANAKDPIRGSSGVLKISKRGLVLLDGDGNEVWTVAVESNNLFAELQDTGNFVLFEIVTSGGRRVLWQSFHHPFNTILPGMILEREQKLRAWKSISDPAGGEFSLELDSKADSDELIMKEGSKTYWKSGYWDPENGLFSNLTELNPNNFFYFKLNTSSIDLHSLTYFSVYSNTRVVIDMTGQLKFFIWYEEGGRWVLVWTEPKDYCDTPVACGPNGVCSDFPCKCLTEFEPASPIDWKQGDYRGGCRRKTPLTCNKDKFMPLSIIQKPKNSVRLNLTVLEGCKSECLDSCNCTAYSFGIAMSTCDIWLQDLMGIGWDFTDLTGEGELVENLQLRLAPLHAVTASKHRRCPPCGDRDVPYPLSTGYGCGDPNFYGNIHCNNDTGELSFSTIHGHSYTITDISPSYRTLVIEAKSGLQCSGESNTQGKLDFDFSRPYFIDNNTNILMLNCSSRLNPQFWTCNSSSPCQTYALNFSCFSSRMCCSNHEGSSEFWRSYSIISAKSCTSFATFIDVELPRNAWMPGVKIGWGKAHEQPLCAMQEDCNDWPNSTCSSKTQLGDEQRCICNENFHWDVQEQSCIEVSNAIGGIKASGELTHQKRRLHLVIIVNVVLASSFIATALLCFMRKMASRKRSADNTLIPLLRRNEEEDIDLPMVQFEVITAATENFSHSNKLGQGGFGPVYKGQLPGGQEIAVKRLSQRSGQGVDEFKNELVLIAKLQHRNLVQLLGYCVEGDERILLYEYMPNRSLDFFLFDNNRCKSLDWKTRFNIIMGIARGLLYLHQDSRLRIIHRDLKASNILLDHEMNPKISDFGIARIFGGKEDEVNTERVVGTYGYMSPEYASHGLFSTKSDVYSFGVILLEIITGQKNAQFHKLEQQFSLLGHVWELWKEGKGLQLVDPDYIEPSDQSEVLKCIHLGLLCVQDYPNDRPTMVSVLVMLMNDTTILPSPRKPAFLIRQSYSRAPSSSSDPNNLSINQVSQTMMDGR